MLLVDNTRLINIVELWIAQNTKTTFDKLNYVYNIIPTS